MEVSSDAPRSLILSGAQSDPGGIRSGFDSLTRHDAILTRDCQTKPNQTKRNKKGSQVILTLAASAAIAGAILSPASETFDCTTMGNMVCGTPDGTLVYFAYDANGAVYPWSTSSPINGQPMCDTDAQCYQLHDFIVPGTTEY